MIESSNPRWFDEQAPLSQLPGESKIAHTQFLTFYNSTHRSLRKLAADYKRQAQNGVPGSKTSLSQIQKWSANHFWFARAATADQIQRIEETRLHNKRRREAINEAWELRALVSKKVQQMLNAPLFQQRIEQDGQLVVVEPTKWTLDTAPKLIREMLRLAETGSSLTNLVRLEPEAEGDDYDGMGVPVTRDGRVITQAEIDCVYEALAAEVVKMLDPEDARLDGSFKNGTGDYSQFYYDDGSSDDPDDWMP